MAASVLSNALLLFDGRDLTGVSNAVGVDYGAEEQDETSLADDTRIALGGLKTVGMSAEGYFDAAVDSDVFSKVGANDGLISVARSPADGEVAYTLQAMQQSLVPLQGSVGELVGYSLNASARGALQRGQILFHDASVIATGTGSALNAGAAASQITAVLHVFSASGTAPTLDVDVESDADSGFGSPVTQISFAQATGRTAERKTAGATADTWWRVNYTIGGTDPDFGFAVILVLE